MKNAFGPVQGMPYRTECDETSSPKLAELMLKLRKDLPKARTPHEQESISARLPPPTSRLTHWCMS